MNPPSKAPVSLNAVVKFLSTADGRDKMYRTAQYGSRLTAYRMEVAGLAKHPAVKHLTKIDKTMSDSRKLFRIAKWLAELKKIRGVDHKDPTMKAILYGRHVAMAVYLMRNDLAWLSKFGLLSSNPKDHSRRAAQAWIVSLTLAIIINLNKLQKNSRDRKRRIANKESLRANAVERRDLILDIIKSSADWFNAFNNMQPKPIFSNGVTGTCGLISSVIGFWQVWPTQ